LRLRCRRLASPFLSTPSAWSQTSGCVRSPSFAARLPLACFKRINPFGVVYHKDLYSKPTAGTSRFDRSAWLSLPFSLSFPRCVDPPLLCFASLFDSKCQGPGPSSRPKLLLLRLRNLLAPPRLHPGSRRIPIPCRLRASGCLSAPFLLPPPLVHLSTNPSSPSMLFRLPLALFHPSSLGQTFLCSVLRPPTLPSALPLLPSLRQPRTVPQLFSLSPNSLQRSLFRLRPRPLRRALLSSTPRPLLEFLRPMLMHQLCFSLPHPSLVTRTACLCQR
jgi:hypothetical protein